jgi:putative DNA primase/helicase
MIVETAIQLVELGLAVCPAYGIQNGRCTCQRGPECQRPGKHPIGKAWQESGLTDPDEVEKAFRESHNISVLTGARYGGLCVLDVDGDAGRASLAELVGKEPLVTLSVVTGSGGAHYYFRAPAGVVIPNSTSKLGKGLDIRGEGGQVIAPPSLHISGQRYRWLESMAAGEVEIALLPSWLVERLTSEAPKPSTFATGADETWIIEGGRNNALFKWGSSLRRKGAGYEEILAFMVAMNQSRCRPPLDLAEVEKTARSVVKYKAGTPVAGKIIGPDEAKADAARAKSTISPVAQAVKPTPDPVQDPTPEPKPALKPEVESPRAPLKTDDPSLDGVSRPWPATDKGNALRFVHYLGEDLRYCADLGRWLFWTGSFWQEDASETADRRWMMTGVDKIWNELKLSRDETETKVISKWAVTSQMAPRLRACVETARRHPRLAVPIHAWDDRPFLLACPNGTINLRTGNFRDPNRHDLLTSCTTVDYCPEARAPRWESFLDQIFEGNADLIGFVQRAVGYSLTGSTAEEVCFLAYGSGANGKTTMLNALREVLGNYARSADPSLLEDGEQHPTGLADLRGARLVVAAELEGGKWLAERRLKTMTSSDRIKARRMRQDFFEFKPTHKLWVMTNHQPRIRSQDHGLWRRLRLIPFSVQIPAEKRERDLDAKLKAEASGILAWAVQGAVDYCKNGLGSPEVVKSSTSDYQKSEDPIGRFLEHCCTFGPECWVRGGRLGKAYEAWAEENGEPKISMVRITRYLAGKGFTRVDGRHTRWVGLALMPEVASELE